MFLVYTSTVGEYIQLEVYTGIYFIYWYILEYNMILVYSGIAILVGGARIPDASCTTAYMSSTQSIITHSQKLQKSILRMFLVILVHTGIYLYVFGT